MGNRRLYKIERFHTPGTPESERLKVTALNLFYPTASPPFPENRFFYIATQSRGGEGRGRGGGGNMKYFIHELRISLMATLSLAILLCGIYPLLVWIVGQGLFPSESNGSLLVTKGTIVGSSLLSQGVTDPKYFHPRPSAAGQGYDAAGSGGSNLGPTSKKLVDGVRQRVFDYRIENGLGPDVMVPTDAGTSSASGFDAHISVKKAPLQ